MRDRLFLMAAWSTTIKVIKIWYYSDKFKQRFFSAKICAGKSLPFYKVEIYNWEEWRWSVLNSQAHSLKPIIQIGKNGLNDQIKTSVRQALDARELIKVTLLQNTDENIHEVAEILEEEIGVETVQKIGRILILFKQSSKKENRKISAKVKEI